MVQIKKILENWSLLLTDFEIKKKTSLEALKVFIDLRNSFTNNLTSKEYSKHFHLILSIKERCDVLAKKLLKLRNEKIEDYEIYGAIIKNIGRD